MRVHHFYPKTRNVGDQLVQRGVERLLRELVPRAAFDLFNVNSRGEDADGYRAEFIQLIDGAALLSPDQNRE